MYKTEFIRIFCARPPNFAWFLGAGASRSTGLPTATDLLWDLKRRYYCSEENEEISRQDTQLEAVRERIQSFVESRGFPAPWTIDEYGTYFKKIFDDDYERQRRYLRAALSEEKVRLLAGHRVLGAYLASGLCRVIFTTNFDSVVEKALAEIAGKSLAAFHLEGTAAANQALNNEEYPFYCKLHGDFRYQSLKNLPSDLVTQNDELAACFLNAASRFGFVVAGFSGRDKSVIDLFRRALAGGNPFPNGLFWTDIPESPVVPAVAELLEAAQARGVNAHYVPIETFDTLMLRLWRNTTDKSDDLDAKVRKARLTPAHIPLSGAGNARPILRLNALPLTSLPKECLALSFATPKEWTDVRVATERAEYSLVLSKTDKILCWGSRELLKLGFAEEPKSVTPYVLPTELDVPDNLTIKRFVEDGLCAALARDKPLMTRATRYDLFLIADNRSPHAVALAGLKRVVGATAGVIAGLFSPVDDKHAVPQQVAWAEALQISIDVKNGQAWLVVDPDIWIWPRHARQVAAEFLRKRRSDRRNERYDAILDAWIRLIFGSDDRNAKASVTAYDGPASSENPEFIFGSRSAFSRRRSA